MLPSIVAPSHGGHELDPDDLVLDLKVGLLDGVLKFYVCPECVADIHWRVWIDEGGVVLKYGVEECREGLAGHVVVFDRVGCFLTAAGVVDVVWWICEYQICFVGYLHQDIHIGREGAVPVDKCRRALPLVLSAGPGLRRLRWSCL